MPKFWREIKARNLTLGILKVTLTEPELSEIINRLILSSTGRKIISDAVGSLDDTFGKGYSTELIIANSLYRLAIEAKSELGYPYDLYLRTILAHFLKDNVSTLPPKFVSDILTHFEEEGDMFLGRF